MLPNVIRTFFSNLKWELAAENIERKTIMQAPVSARVCLPSKPSQTEQQLEGVHDHL